MRRPNNSKNGIQVSTRLEQKVFQLMVLESLTDSTCRNLFNVGAKIYTRLEK